MRGMVAECLGSFRRFQAVLALALAACAQQPPVLEQQVFLQVPTSQAASLPVPAEVAASGARTLIEYRRQVSELLHAANAKDVFAGTPPNPLRAVIVVYVEVDADGVLRMLHLYRAPPHSPELVDEVERAWRRLGPQLPRPLPELMALQERLVFTQTWLFDYEGRFRLRNLSLPQDALPVEDES